LLVLERLEDRTLPSVFTVTNTADSGAGSLRQAILDASATADDASITFNVTGSGVQTIQLQSALLTVATPMSIDATSQPGYTNSPLIAVDGTNAGAGVAGLTITCGSSFVQGLQISHFIGSGIQDFLGFATGNHVQYLTITGSGGDGIVVSNTAGDSILYNTIPNNAGNGITANSTTLNFIECNTLTGNAGAGLVANNGSSNIIAANTIIGSGGDGATLTGNCVPAATVSWWHADGNANESVGSNNGSLQGGATFAPGKSGQAFSLDGVNAFIDVPTSTCNTQPRWISTPRASPAARTRSRSPAGWARTPASTTRPRIPGGSCKSSVAPRRSWRRRPAARR
jgi:hypothetical protein